MRRIFSLIICITCATTLFAQDVFQKELFDGSFVLRQRDEIALTDQQVDKILALYADQADDYGQLMNTMQLQINKMQLELGQLTMDKAAILELFDQLSETETTIKRIRLETLVDVKNILEPEQMEKLREMKPESAGSILITPLTDDYDTDIKITQKNPGKEPLYIINRDGTPEEVSDVKNLKPDDIESIEVLKGESAEAVYGEKGKNGVVIITLKK